MRVKSKYDETSFGDYLFRKISGIKIPLMYRLPWNKLALRRKLG